MWNHSASMRGQTGPPKLEQGEMSNLVAFLFHSLISFSGGMTSEDATYLKPRTAPAAMRKIVKKPARPI